MLKPKLAFIFAILSSLTSFAQQQKLPVVITEKVELVEYEYEYLYVEFATSAIVSTYFPIYRTQTPSSEQLFFEAGRNERLGFELGIQQSFSIEKFSFSTGLEFQQFYENFSYGEYQTREVEFYNGEGMLELRTVAIGDPVVTSTLNQLSYLKIPVQLAYKVKLRKTNFNFLAGINYHRLVFSTFKTKYSLNRPAANLKIQDFNPSYFSISAGISLTSKLSDKLDLIYGPYFNYGLNNIIDQDELCFGLSHIGIKLILSMPY